MPTTSKQQQNVPSDGAGFVAAVLPGTNFDNPRSVAAALDQMFRVTADPVTGSTSVRFVPSTLVALASSSSVKTGASKSRRDFAANYAEQIRKLIQQVQPLHAENRENVDILRSLFLDSVDDVVRELGSPEPLVPLISSLGHQMLPHQFKALADALGYDNEACIGDVAKELTRTDIDNVEMYVELLADICNEMKHEPARGDLSLGTHAIAVEHALACVAEATEQFREALQQAGVDPHCSSVKLPGGRTATLGKVIESLESFVSGRAPTLTSWKAGYTLSLAPRLAMLNDIMKNLKGTDAKLFDDPSVKRTLSTLKEQVESAHKLAAEIKGPHVTNDASATLPHEGRLPIRKRKVRSTYLDSAGSYEPQTTYSRPKTER